VRVLSIDGGGVRGLLPAAIIAEIEARTGKPTHELFDLMVGTSIGGIAVMALTAPDREDPGKPRHSAAELVEFYTEIAPRIFSVSVSRWVRTGDRLLHEKYPNEILDQVLDEAFADTTLAEALTPIMVTAFDTESRRPLMFKSEEAKREPASNLPMRIVGRAAVAAPTLFEPVHLKMANGEHATCVDGGIYANNPAMCAYVEALKMGSGANVLMVSIGTGLPDRSLSYEEVRKWGLFHWAEPLLDFSASGVNLAVNHQLEHLLGRQSYYRLQAFIGQKHLRMDDAHDTNLKMVRDAATALITERDSDLETICECLLEQPVATDYS
jgi:patatin-like phospholipase/acyl hydrolase